MNTARKSILRSIQEMTLLLLVFFLATQPLFAQSIPIVLNEFLASNQSITRDLDGAYSDWIELYNLGSTPIDLNGYGLTDDPALPFKWRFPAVKIPARGYLLIWASGKDRTTSQLHTNFKLSATGEFLGLYDPSGTRIDGLNFSMQSADISSARIPDGTGSFVFTAKPTPQTPNQYIDPGGKSLEILSPNGGEVLTGNTEVYIRWRSSGNIGQIRLDYTLDGGTTWRVLDNSTPDDGQRRWMVPNEPSSLCLVRAISLLDTLVTDKSDGYFQVKAASSGKAIVINELLARNGSVNTDEDGNYSDWFELYNPLGYAVDLSGYGITDDALLPFKWRFPPVKIPAGGYFLVWASGKDRGVGELHTNFSLNGGGEYLGLYGPDGKPIDEVTFGNMDTDISLARIPDGTGAFTKTSAVTPDGKNRYQEIINDQLKILYPKGSEKLSIGSTIRILWQSTGNIGDLKFEYSIDGGATWQLIDAYVVNDGSKSWRVPNVSSTRCRIRISDLATQQIWDESDTDFQITPPQRVMGDLIINEFMASNLFTILDEDGNPSDWIELLNNGNSAIDLSGYYLTDDLFDLNQWKFPPVQISPGEFLLIWASGKNRKSGELHTNFALSKSGEYLALITPQNEILDEIYFGKQYQDVSEARYPDGSGEFQATLTPTPGSPNRIENPPEGSLTITPIGGFYSGTKNVEIKGNLEGIEIRYTTDGSTVKATSQPYSGPIPINNTTVLRARGFLNDIPVTSEVSEFYLFNFQGHLPVLSIATDYDNLYGSGGIFTNYDKTGRNYEVPAAVNFIELDGGGFRIFAGLRVHGQHARQYPKKSMRLYFRKVYGKGKLQYKVFPELNLDKFDVLVVHSGGSEDQYYSDREWSLLRDPLMHTLLGKMGGVVSAHRPVLLYLNGEFFGIYYFRERIDKNYLRDHFGSLNSDLLKWHHNVIPEVQEGDRNAWLQFYNFFENNTLISNAKYEWIKKQMDIKNFTDYQLIEIYGGNKDWPHNNNYFFQERADTAKWRWILWDAESGFFDKNIDLMAWASRSKPRTDISPSDGEYQLFATLIFRRLLENSQYRTYFMVRACDLLNTILRTDSIRTEFMKLKKKIRDDIPLENERWGPMRYTWNDGIAILEDFIQNRTSIVRYHIGRYFGKYATARILLEADSSQGFIKLNSIQITHFPWKGIYFNGLPLSVQAIPRLGYEFVRWEGDISSPTQTIQFNIQQDIVLKAIFRPSIQKGMLRINEIVPDNQTGIQDGNGQYSDWIELKNLTGDSLNLKGCHLTDDPNNLTKWSLPDITIPPFGFLVIWASGLDSCGTTEWHTNFKLNKEGEFLGLLTPLHEYLDSLTFGKVPPDIALARNPTTGELKLTRVPTANAENVIQNLFSAIQGNIRYRTTQRPIDRVKIVLASDSLTRIYFNGGSGFICDSLLGGKNYRLMFSKPRGEDQNNALMFYDAALVARSSLGLQMLAEKAKIAGDVDGDKALTLYDAALIARNIVGLPDVGGSKAGEWKFTQDTLQWFATWGDTLQCVIEGMILGDVDANWGTKLAKPSLGNIELSLERYHVSDDSLLVLLKAKGKKKIISFDLQIELAKGLKLQSVHISINSKKMVYFKNQKANIAYLGGYFLDTALPDSLYLILNFKIEPLKTQPFPIGVKRFLLNNELMNLNKKWSITVNQETGPKKVKIYPNFPNPFNISTLFKIDVPTKSLWTIKVFDIQGRLVDRIFQGILAPGRHHFLWNASENILSLPSGQYFVHFKSKELTKTLKVVYIK